MYGSRFNRFTKRYPRRSTRRTYRKKFYRGGNIYHLSIVEMEQVDNTPRDRASSWFPILNNSFYQDEQYVALLEGNQWEGEDRPIDFAGGLFDVNIWCTTPVASSLLYIPTVFAFVIVDEATVGPEGNPDEIIPSDYQNYFLRDYGTNDAHPLIETEDNAPFKGERSFRTLYRKFTMQDAGSYNGISSAYQGPNWRKSYSCRLRRARMTKNQGLWFTMQAYNTSAASVTLGYSIGGHFGYRRSPGNMG